MNNLLLAFITQEFSLAVIRSKTLKQSIIIVQGVICSSLRYSIYKVHLALASANSVIIAPMFSFVKHFFQILANFFSVRFFLARSPERLHILPDVSPFVNTFFHIFAIIFCAQKNTKRGLFRALLNDPITSHLPADHNRHFRAYRLPQRHRCYPHP